MYYIHIFSLSLCTRVVLFALYFRISIAFEITLFWNSSFEMIFFFGYSYFHSKIPLSATPGLIFLFVCFDEELRGSFSFYCFQYFTYYIISFYILIFILIMWLCFLLLFVKNFTYVFHVVSLANHIEFCRGNVLNTFWHNLTPIYWCRFA